MKKLRPYQESIKQSLYREWETNKNVLLVLPTGCIAGDTILNLNRASKGYNRSISKAFDNQNDIRVNKSIPTKIRSYKDGIIKLSECDGIKYSGQKFCIKLKSKTREIILTPDHRILTPFGWVEARNMHGKKWFVEFSTRPCKKSNTHTGWETVESIEDFGITDTYDVINSETENFMANGIVVHNCGKTVTFCSVVKDLAIDGIFGDKEPTIILVHRKELLAQISVTLAKEGIIHSIIAPQSTARNIIGMQRLECGKPFYSATASVIIASVDTLNSRILRYPNLPFQIKRWVCDEAAHVLKDNKWGRALSIFKDAKGLGVTATPERLDKKGLGSQYDGIFDSMIVGVTPRWAIQNGFLSKYKIVAPKTDYEQYLGDVKSNTSDFSKEQMAHAANVSHIVGDTVENYKKFASGMQTIVFASDINSAEKMEKKFIESGIPAKLLTGECTDKERFDSVNAFKNNTLKILINVDLFDEGFDIPASVDKQIVECVILARPTMSLGKYLQMIGRGLRVSPLKDHAIIIDQVNNIRRHGLPDTDRKWSLARPERRKKKSKIRICDECASAYDRILTSCPYCGAKPEKKEGAGGGRIPPEQVDGDLVLIDPETIREMDAATILESPASVAERVSAVAGAIAGKSAAKKQLERIDTQSKLKEVIANWAGRETANGLSDREIHKKFFIENDMTIAQAISQPTLQMKNLIEDLDE